MKKNTKKTATVVGMFGLLGLVLGMGGSTFAKYQTAATPTTQNATVAKWGVVAQITDTSGKSAGETGYTPMFSKEYGDTVKTTGEKFVVAPGTSGEIKLSISGTPEVSAKVVASLSITDVYLKDDADAYYYPIKWTIDGTSYQGSGESNKTKTVSVDKTFKPNTSVATTITVKWEWPFVDDEAINTKDTCLGDYAAGKDLPTDYEANIALSYTLTGTVSQID